MLFSVITVNRNNAKGLKDTIQSVLEQSFQDFEYIVIDGASTDQSIDVIRQYSFGISSWVSEKDDGIYDAMNKGLHLAHGEYCIFMNSGDVFFDVDVLKNVSEVRHKTDIIAGRAITTRGTLINPPDQLSFRFLFHSNISHQAEFIKKCLFDTIGFYSTDLRILSDYEFNIKASLADISYFQVPITVSRLEEGGISCSEVETMDQEREVIFRRLLPSSIFSDYKFWLNSSTYSHPSVQWLIERPRIMKIIKRLYHL